MDANTATEDQAVESKKIQRYSLRAAEADGYLEPGDQGEWVRYEDHVAAMLNPMGHQLTQDDAATMQLIQMLLDTIADLEQSPEFAGFQFQRATNSTGELQFVRLMPCDKIGDVTVPRYSDPDGKKVLAKAVKSALVSV